MAIWGHDYSNFEGGKIYLIYPLELIDKFWPSNEKEELKIKIVTIKMELLIIPQNITR